MQTPLARSDAGFRFADNGKWKDRAEPETGSGISGQMSCGSVPYYVASVILVLGNLFLGLFAPVSVNMIRQGLSMFQ